MLQISKKNLAAIIMWLFGILGGLGFINPIGFLVLLIPILFIIFGSKFTKNHGRVYFNVLISASLVYLTGFLLNKVVNVELIYTIAYIYLLVTSLLGIFDALRRKHFRAPLAFRVFR